VVSRRGHPPRLITAHLSARPTAAPTNKAATPDDTNFGSIPSYLEGFLGKTEFNNMGRRVQDNAPCNGHLSLVTAPNVAYGSSRESLFVHLRSSTAQRDAEGPIVDHDAAWVRRTAPPQMGL
jgi:hypothetical protein